MKRVKWLKSILGLAPLVLICLIFCSFSMPEIAEASDKIYVNSGVTYTLDSGTISNGSGTNGGGVVVSGGTLVMNGGEISNNSATNYGAGVFIDTGTFNMNGGNIVSNECGHSSGGVMIRKNGTLTLKNGHINNNSATNYAGGVSVYEGTFNMNGGEITGNTSNKGGGVEVSAGKMVMTAGTIAGNTAELGNEIYIWNTGAFEFRGGTIGKSTDTSKVGVYFGNGTFTYYGGTMYCILRSESSLVFGAVPTSTFRIENGSTANGAVVAQVASGVSASSVMAKLQVTNLPSDCALAVSGSNIIIQKMCTLTFSVSPDSSYGSVTESSVRVPSGSTYSVSGSTLTIKPVGSSNIYVYANVKEVGQYTYSFDSWNVSSSGTITANMSFVARFTRTVTSFPTYFATDGHGTVNCVETSQYNVNHILLSLSYGSRIVKEGGEGVLHVFDNESGDDYYIEAVANAGYVFNHWEYRTPLDGDGMQEDSYYEFLAYFDEAPMCEVYIYNMSSGLGGVDGEGTHYYPQGTTYDATTAVLRIGSDYYQAAELNRYVRFLGWSCGGCASGGLTGTLDGSYADFGAEFYSTAFLPHTTIQQTSKEMFITKLAHVEIAQNYNLVASNNILTHLINTLRNVFLSI